MDEKTATADDKMRLPKAFIVETPGGFTPPEIKGRSSLRVEKSECRNGIFSIHFQICKEVLKDFEG
jgi:hypothetical protein